MDGEKATNASPNQRSDNTFHYITPPPPDGLMAVFGYWRKENKNIKRIKRKILYANNIHPIDPTATPKKKYI